MIPMVATPPTDGGNGELIAWGLGLSIAICISLIAAIWRSTRSEISWMKQTMAELQRAQGTTASEVQNIRAHCKDVDKVRVDDARLRSILREELDRFKEEIPSLIKLQLIEEGYIKQPSAKNPRRNNGKKA